MFPAVCPYKSVFKYSVLIAHRHQSAKLYTETSQFVCTYTADLRTLTVQRLSETNHHVLNANRHCSCHLTGTHETAFHRAKNNSSTNLF